MRRQSESPSNTRELNRYRDRLFEKVQAFRDVADGEARRMMRESFKHLPHSADKAMLHHEAKALSRPGQGEDALQNAAYRLIACDALNASRVDSYENHSDLAEAYNHLRSRRFNANDHTALRIADALTHSERQRRVGQVVEEQLYPIDQIQLASKMRELDEAIHKFGDGGDDARKMVGLAAMWRMLEERRTHETGPLCFWRPDEVENELWVYPKSRHPGKL